MFLSSDLYTILLLFLLMPTLLVSHRLKLKRNPDCPTVSDSVCGVILNEDGTIEEKTFSNQCFANVEKASEITKGECERDPMCIMVYDPVCGTILNTDGKIEKKTFSNECFAKIENASDVTKGECEKHISCPQTREPVCGSIITTTGEKQDKTFPNECIAKVAGVFQSTEGECTRDIACSNNYAPVCGVIVTGTGEGHTKTFPNRCIATTLAGAVNITEGECKHDRICPRIYAPVCGVIASTIANTHEIERKTFPNNCVAVGAGAVRITEGECERDAICSMIYAPVCGVIVTNKGGTTHTQRKTFPNKCIAIAANAINIAEGKCDEKCSGVQCAIPVCPGGKTYVDGVCCPQCLQQRCKAPDGRTYQHGEIWSDPQDPCTSHQCDDGEIHTMVVDCYPVECPRSARPINVDGKCCPVCPRAKRCVNKALYLGLDGKPDTCVCRNSHQEWAPDPKKPKLGKCMKIKK